MSTAERFWAKVRKTRGCWWWTGSNNGLGYGEIRINGKKVYAHRWSHESSTGQRIPPGYQIDHLCRNPACVRPDHLEVVTPTVNVRRGEVVGPKPHRRRVFCINGHAYDENTYLRPDGKGRNCAACVRDRAREYMRRKKGYYQRHPEACLQSK